MFGDTVAENVRRVNCGLRAGRPGVSMLVSPTHQQLFDAMGSCANPNSQRLEKRDPEEKPRSLYPFRFALDPAGVPGLGTSPGVWGKTALCAVR